MRYPPAPQVKFVGKAAIVTAAITSMARNLRIIVVIITSKNIKIKMGSSQVFADVGLYLWIQLPFFCHVGVVTHWL